MYMYVKKNKINPVSNVCIITIIHVNVYIVMMLCMKGHVDDHILHVHVYIVPTILTELLYQLQCGETPLHTAARKGHTTIVEHLLSTPGIDVNIKNKVSWSIEYLKMCTVIGTVAYDVLHVHVRILPTMLTELLYPLQTGHTPLHWAAVLGRTSCVERLLSTPGIDVNIKDKVSWSTEYSNKICTVIGTVADHVLHVHVCILPTMLAELLYPLQYNLYTPLHEAVINGHTTCVEHLLSTPGIDVNIMDKVSWTTEY